jgi:1-acyl-sn-glycerol-3-phosphate acyltransferase
MTTLHPEVQETIDLLHQAEVRDGIDPFGYRPEMVGRVLPVTHLLYRYWFRTITTGIENVPAGRVLLIANHSGQIPLDGAMIGTSMLLEHRPPRLLRSMVERWVPTLPFVSTFFSRCGQVVGTPENARRLLELDEGLLVFPEGSAGISKPWRKRYQLQRFGTGFVRLALQTSTPIVPVAVIGAEEQLPSIGSFDALARLLKFPAVPIVPTGPVPLPVRYRLIYGEPIHLTGDWDDEDRIIAGHVRLPTPLSSPGSPVDSVVWSPVPSTPTDNSSGSTPADVAMCPRLWRFTNTTSAAGRPKICSDATASTLSSTSKPRQTGPAQPRSRVGAVFWAHKDCWSSAIDTACQRSSSCPAPTPTDPARTTTSF